MEAQGGGAAFVVHNDAGERQWVLSGIRLIKARSAHSGGWTLGEERMPAGAATPLHLHEDEAEGYYVLEGELELHLPDGEQVLRAGDFALIPAGVEHRHLVRRDARWLGLGGPRFEAFLDAAGTPARPGRQQGPEPDLDRIVAAAGRHGTRILGPPAAG